MKILLTGAFGSVGECTLQELLKKGFDVRCFDIKESPYFPRNAKTAQKYKGKTEILWGDIRKISDVEKAVIGTDIVIHTAAVIPPLADKIPQYTNEVIVEGTRNIIEAMKGLEHKPKLIYTSSVAVYGDVRKKVPPVIMDDDPPTETPCDDYTCHKIECERMIKKSGLIYAILRLSYVVSLKQLKMDPLMFRVPLDTLMQPVHSQDVGLALANAVTCDGIWGQTLNIAGGNCCRTNYREYLDNMMDIFGIGSLPGKAFSDEPFHLGHMDTKTSQRLLKYQKTTLEDIFNETRDKKKFLRLASIAFRPLARFFLLYKSPYYKKSK